MTAMICLSCDFENPKGIKFCGQCGALLTGRCPSCGFESPPNFRFCGECGESLSRDSYIGASTTDSESAMNVAREWTRSSIDSVSRILGVAATEETPILQNVASSLIRNQIQQRIEWTFSDPENLTGVRYRVIATGSAPLEVGLLSHKWRSTASANFELMIDASEKRILESKMLPKSFKIISSEETEKLRERVNEEVGKFKGKLRGFFRG